MRSSIVCRRAALALAALPLLAAALVAHPAADAVRGEVVGLRAAAVADATRADLIPGGSEARYRAQEVLTGYGVNEAVGRTSDVTGAVLLDASGGVFADQSRISVDLRSLRSDSTMRDRYIQRSTLETQNYPTADFVVSAAPGLPSPLPASGDAMFQLVGDLTVHGVTQPTTWEVTATFGDGEVRGLAATSVRITDFGMEPPRAGPVLSIDDGMRLEIDFRASVSPSMGLDGTSQAAGLE